MDEPALTDGVVALRPWRREDAPALVDCLNGDPEITIWLDQIPQPYSLSDALDYIGGVGEQAFAILDEDGRLAGSIGVRWNEPRDVGEIGYWARRDVRGCGLMTRALVLIASFAIRHEGAARVQLRADVENTASRRVAEKAGFTFEGVLRAAHWNERLGRRQDWAMYSLLPDELA